MTTLHAHIETYAVDCDGPTSRSYPMTMTPSEAAKDFADIDFTDRVVAHVVNAYSIFQQGTLTVTRLNDGSVRLDWSESTEEGGRNVQATLCQDDCDDDAFLSTYRDHRAEEAGY